MANIKISRQVDGVPDNEDISPIVVPNVPAGTIIKQGSVWCQDITQPSISPASLIASLAPGYSTFYPAYTPTAEVCVPPFSPNVGPVVGVYQGPTFTLTTAPLKTGLPVRNTGFGLVLAGSEGANAVNTGSNLIISTTQYGAKQGAAALSSQVGVAGGYLINTTLLSATAAGAGVVVNLVGEIGMATTVPLTFDTPQSGVQEVATPTAVVYGVNANQAFTVATPQTGDVVTTTIGGVAVAYTILATDTTATIAAASIVKALNLSTLVTGPSPLILPPTSAAGVITVRAINAGTASNSITTVGSKTGGGTTTYSAGAGTMASGTNNTVTVTLLNAHGAGTVVQGIINGNASTLITTATFQQYLVNAFIQIR